MDGMKDESLKEDPENSERRRDSRNLQGELPWPRLLTIKNRPGGRLVCLEKNGKQFLSGSSRNNENYKKSGSSPFKIETARICMPNGSVFEDAVYADSVS